MSHTFILREVVELRKLGFEISVASINGLDRPPDQLAVEEREEARTSWYLKAQGIAGALGACLPGALSRPGGLLNGILFAVRLGGGDPRRILKCGAYLIEALMLGRWMEQHHLRHVHVHFATPASTVGLILTRIFPFTFSITVHGPDEFYDVSGY